MITGVEVFERAYAAVGMGWVYAFTRVPALLNAANAVYDVWGEVQIGGDGQRVARRTLEGEKGARRWGDVRGRQGVRVIPFTVVLIPFNE